MKKVTHKDCDSVYDAWLASACMPPGILHQLLSIYRDPEECYEAFRKREEQLQNIVTTRFFTLLEKNGTDEKMKSMQKAMEKMNIQVLRFTDPDFPSALRNIDEPPALLFFQGDLQCLKMKTITMVGSRAASYTGQKAANRIAGELSRKGICIVSGFACGIDAASHQGCIEGGSPTIAVIACGQDIVYPKENTLLRDKILAGNGLILSEYAPGEKPAGWHFPFRNRLIAGLGQALILIEAKTRSGSMTTVHHALDQGKDVFIYPGDPESDKFEGNHQLLREGGIYFTSAEDILEDMHWLDNQPAVRQNSDCSIVAQDVSPEQHAVIGALIPGKLSFEQLLDKTGMDPSRLMSTITVMQISGIIESLPGKQYQLKH